MKTTLKQSLIYVVLILTLFSGIFLGLKAFMHLHYEKLDAQYLVEDLQRARNLLLNEIDSLVTVCRDYSAWDDAWEFVRSGDRKFIASNLEESIYPKLRIDLLAYFDGEHRLVFGTYISPLGEMGHEIPAGVMERTKKGGSLWADDPGKPIKGIMSLPDGMYEISASPVTRSNGTLPSGVLLMGRRISPGEQQRLSRIFAMEMGITPWHTSSDAPSLRPLIHRIDSGGIELSDSLPGSPRVAAVMLRDIDGNPAAILHITDRRMIRERIAQSSDLILLVLVTGGFILSVSALFFLMRSRSFQKQHQSTQRKLAESEERFGSVFANAGLAIVLADRNRVIQSCNPYAERFFGYSREEMTGRPIAFLSHPDDEELNQELGKSALTEKRPAYSMEKRYIRKDGTTVWGNLTVSYLFDERGEVDIIVGMVQDITDRKRYERQIEGMNELLETRVAERTAELRSALEHMESFSYSISHDLRAPLRALDGYSQMIIEETGDSLQEPVRTWLDRISHNARTMAALIDDLLTFSRLNRQQVVRKTVNLTEVIGEIAQSLGVDAMHDVSISCGHLPPVDADPGLVRQVFFNLIENAVKYRDPTRPATISVTAVVQEGKPVIYQVTDNGIGFDMQYHDRIFGVFQRLHREGDIPGTGVGLAIVQNIVHRHGGWVRAESALGVGSTFSFTLEPETVQDGESSPS